MCQDPSQSIRVAKYAVRVIVAFDGQPDPSAAAMSQSQSQTAASQSQSQSQSQSSSEDQDTSSASGTDVGGLVSRLCHAAMLYLRARAGSVRGGWCLAPELWTILQYDGPNHLRLW